MHLMTRYILRQLITGTVLVTVGLLCILWLTQSLRFVELIITRGLSFGTFLHLTGLLLPNFLVIILPVALFAVVLFTYNKMSGDRELTVLRAAGVSPLRLAKPALLLALLLTIVGYAMSLHFVPRSVMAFKELQWTVRNDVSRLLIQEGAFSTVAPGITVYVRGRTESGELLGVLVHDTREPEQTVTIMAERGGLMYSEDGPRVILANGSRHSVEAGTGRLSLLNFDSYVMEISTGGGGEGPRHRESSERSLSELLNLQSKDGGLRPVEIRQFRVEAHQRLATPMSYFAFTLIALACLLTGPFDRRGGTRRVVTATGLLVLTETAILGSANLAANSIVFLPLIYASVLTPLIIAGAVLVAPLLKSGAGVRRMVS